MLALTLRGFGRVLHYRNLGFARQKTRASSSKTATRRWAERRRSTFRAACYRRGIRAGKPANARSKALSCPGPTHCLPAEEPPLMLRGCT